MATTNFYFDHSELNERQYYNGIYYNSWQDKTNESTVGIYQDNRTAAGTYYKKYQFQFRFPANSVLGVSSISAITLYLYLNGDQVVYSTTKLRVGRSTTYENTNSSYTTTSEDITSTAVWRSIDVTSICSGVNFTNLWYLDLALYVSGSSNYDDFNFCSDVDNASYAPYLEITYNPPYCVAPTTVDVDLSTPPTSYPITVSWNSGTAGSGNAITGYSVQRCATVDGTYVEIDTTQPEIREYEDSSPETATNSYFYKIKTLGTLTGYDSDLSTDYAQTTATTTTDCVASTTIEANSETPEPSSSSTITWNAGTAGTNNSITGYELYRDVVYDGSFVTLVAETDDSTLSASVIAPPTDGNSYYYRIKTIGTYDGYNSDLSTSYATVTATQSAAACSAPTAISISDEYPEPEDLIDISFSGASSGDGNAITGYELYSDISESGSFSTLVDSLATSSTSGSFEDISSSSSYGVTTYYKIRTIGTLEGYDSGLSASVISLTSLTADYTISLPEQATLPNSINYIVIYYDSSNVYDVSDDSVLDVVNTETVLPVSGVYNDVGTSTYIFYVTNYSVPAYVTASTARQLTESEQEYFLAHGTTLTEKIIKQWTGTEWTTNISSNVGAWSQAAASEINQTANEIFFKVSKGAVISEINQTAEEIKIQASKISLEGLVTANSYFKILEDGSMEATAGKFAGNLTATTTYCNNLQLNSGKEMTVGLWKIGSTGIYYPSGMGYNYLAFLYTGSQAYVSAHAPMHLGPDLGNPLYITASTINFSTTYATYSADIGPDESASGYSDITFNPSEDQAGNIGTPTRLWDTMSCRVLYYVSGGQASSIKLKKDVKCYTEDTGKIVDSLEVKTFKYDKKNENEEHIGLIWEDAVKIVPQMCYQHKEGSDESKCINYNELSVILLKEVQNLRKRVKELEDKINK